MKLAGLSWPRIKLFLKGRPGDRDTYIRHLMLQEYSTYKRHHILSRLLGLYAKEFKVRNGKYPNRKELRAQLGIPSAKEREEK